MDEEKPKKLNTVPVTLLKRRKRASRDLIKQQRVRSEEIRKRAKTRRSQFHRPAYFISVARKRSRDEMRLKRVAIRKTPILVGGVPKLGLVIRLQKETNEISQSCMDVFRLLRLDTYNQAVFVKITQPMLEILNIVAPYVAWGYPSLQVVRDIISKRGRTMLGVHKHSIDNKIIEEKLGYCGILCLEDIIHELVTLGPNLRAVLRFLCPFKLMPPSQNWLSGSKRCHARGDQLTAFREEQINEMVKRMI